MKKLLIDTDIAIDFLRGTKYIKKFILSKLEMNSVNLSILSVYELFAGMKNSEIEATENFICACNIEPITLQISKKAGEIFRHYRTKGITLTSVDCLITSTAIICEYLIVTNNTKHYPDKKLIYKVS